MDDENAVDLVSEVTRVAVTISHVVALEVTGFTVSQMTPHEKTLLLTVTGLSATSQRKSLPSQHAALMYFSSAHLFISFFFLLFFLHFHSTWFLVTARARAG